jgi:hypothetical protein
MTMTTDDLLLVRSQVAAARESVNRALDDVSDPEAVTTLSWVHVGLDIQLRRLDDLMKKAVAA